MKKIIVLALILWLYGCNSTSFAHENIYEDESKITSSYSQYNYHIRDGEITKSNISLKFDFTGIDKLWTITVQEDKEIEILYNADINEGMFKTVLVTPENKISTTLEGNSMAKVLLKLNKGDNIIKIVGYKAKGTIDINIFEEESDISIVPVKRDGFPWD